MGGEVVSADVDTASPPRPAAPVLRTFHPGRLSRGQYRVTLETGLRLVTAWHVVGIGAAFVALVATLNPAGNEGLPGAIAFLLVAVHALAVLGHAYSAVGIRGDCDIMLWRISYDLELFQEMSTKIMASGLGKYLSTPYSYLSMTKRSIYVSNHRHEGQDGMRLRISPAGARYLFVYPFVKTRAWYQLSTEERQRMMTEHIRIGHKYPSVKLNTTYSLRCEGRHISHARRRLGG